MGFPAMQKTWVQPLSWEDALEKELATHSSILAWEIPQTEEPGGRESMGSQKVKIAPDFIPFQLFVKNI